MPTTCAADIECGGYRGALVCDEVAERCVGCVDASDCPFPESATCLDHRCGLACDDDELAPNQAREDAAALDLSTPVSLPDLQLCGVYAEDWFRFTLDAPTPLRVMTRFDPLEGDIDVELFRAGSVQPVAAAATYDAPERMLLESVGPGTFELHVYFYPRSTDPEPPTRASQGYGLEIVAARPGAGRCPTAPLALGEHTGLALCDVPSDPNDPDERHDDWYRVDVAAGDTLAAEATWPEGATSLSVELMDEDGVVLNGPPPWETGRWRVSWIATRTGSVWVRVARNGAWSTTPYTLRLWLADCDEHADCGLGEVCADLSCAATTCSGDLECAAYGSTFTCDEGPGHCRECALDDECAPEWMICRQGHCALPCTPDALEPVGDIAMPVAITMPFAGDDLNLCGQLDLDLFGFELAASRTYTFRVTPSTHGPDAVRVTLLRPEPTAPLGLGFVKAATTSGDAQLLSYTTGGTAGLFVLEVQWNTLDGALTYDLTIE